MYALIGLFLFLVTLVPGVEDMQIFRHNSLSPPLASCQSPSLQAFRHLLPPHLRLGKTCETEPPRETCLPLLSLAPAVPVIVRPILPVVPPKPTPIDSMIRHLSRCHGLEEKLVRAVISHESGFDTDAVSPQGALGLMQLMPETADQMGVRDVFDPRQNLAGGLKFLKICLNRFGHDVGLALAAYNAGPGNVEKYGGCPPFAETQKFVLRVMEECYGPDWPKLTRMTLPDLELLIRQGADKSGLSRKTTEAPRASLTGGSPPSVPSSLRGRGPVRLASRKPPE